MGCCKGNYGVPLRGFGMIKGKFRVVVMIIWEFPKIRGPNIESNVLSFLL